MSVFQEQPRPEKQGGMLGYRYTGFPEPLSHDRNTTLPHPDADLSPHAVLEGDHALSLARTTSRIHLLGHRSRSTASKHGSFLHWNSSKASDVGLVLHPADMYQGIEYADGTKEDERLKLGESRDSGVDIGRRDSRGKGEISGSGSESESGSEEGGERRKRKGFFKKLTSKH